MFSWRCLTSGWGIPQPDREVSERGVSGHAEIPVVERGQRRNLEALGHGDHAGVDQSEAEIGVLLDQLDAASAAVDVQVDYPPLASGDQT